MIQPVPAGAHLAQRLFYDQDRELLVYWHQRKVYIRDGFGRFPVCPIRGVPHPDPYEGTEGADASYETLGLYYNYGMPGTGWSSNGEY